MNRGNWQLRSLSLILAFSIGAGAAELIRWRADVDVPATESLPAPASTQSDRDWADCMDVEYERLMVRFSDLLAEKEGLVIAIKTEATSLEQKSDLREQLRKLERSIARLDLELRGLRMRQRPQRDLLYRECYRR